MADHADRAHATWSASATARNWACPGALRLTSTVTRDVESEAAAWGTACHQVAEKCLNNGFDAADLIGRTERTKEHWIEIDEEMVDTAQVYVDYVRTANLTADWTKVEQQFSLAALAPPFDAGGTADAVIYTSALRMLEVVDLKGGRGVVVDAKGNPQLRTYALGALLAHQGLDIDKVQVTIIQPRVSKAPKSEMFHVADLVEWTADLLAAMRRSAAPDAPLVPGPHCTKTFCPAAGFCPALQSKAMEEARLHFNDLGGIERPNAPDTFMPEDIARILDHADMIEDWIKAVRAYAHAQAEAGVVVPGYQLVEKIGRRAWKDEMAAREALYVKFDLGDDAVFQPPKLKSPAMIDKMLGERKGEIADLWEAPVTGTNLVSSSKTTRAPAKPAAQQHFSVLD